MENIHNKLFFFTLLLSLFMLYIANNNFYGKNNSTSCVKYSIKYIYEPDKKYNYILSEPKTNDKRLLKLRTFMGKNKNIHTYVKNNVQFCNKKNLANLLKKYSAVNICPSSYSFPEDYPRYESECKNKKMILKSNTQRQEGLFITTNIQSKKFIEEEKIIVAQEYIQDCIEYNNHRLAFRLWLIILCTKNYVSGYVGKDGLVYYNNNADPNISSFYGSYELYDKGYPIVISDLDKQNIIMPLLINKLKDLMNVIKKENNINDNNDDVYIEMFGVDLHMTNDNKSYVLEINRGPGMTSYSEKDDKIRSKMLKGYIDLIHNKKNDFLHLL